MNNSRFLLLLNAGTQETYYILTQEILRYATYEAKGLDNADGVACRALAKVEDLLIAGKSYNSWWHVKGIIRYFIISERRKRAADNTYLKNGFPKDPINYIKNPTERLICYYYWCDGKKQQEIVDQIGKSKQYVSKVIKRHKKVDNKIFEYGYSQFKKDISTSVQYSKTPNYFDHFPKK